MFRNLSLSACLLLSLFPAAVHAQDPVEETITVDGLGAGRKYRIEPRPAPMPSFPGAPPMFSEFGGGGGGFSGNFGQVEQDANASATSCSSSEATAGSNPILLTTGNKVETDLDFASSGAEMPLYLERTYNRYWQGSGLFSRHWQSNFDYALSFETSKTTSPCYPEPGNYPTCSTIPTQPLILWAHRPDGRRIKFPWNAAANAWLEDKPSPVAKFVKNADGTYTLTSEEGTTERYSNIGYVLEVKNEAGIGWTFSYVNYYPV